MMFDSPDPAPVALPTLPKPAPPPILAMMPQGQRPKRKPTTPTFLGNSAVPSSPTQQGKTLLGQ